MSGIAHTCIHRSRSTGSLTIHTLVIILISALLCNSCHHEQRFDASTFRFNDASGIQSLDPALASYQSAIWAGTQLYNGLVELDSALQVQPALARSWSVDTSGCEWIFHLRTDVYFHEDSCFGDMRTRRLRSSDVQFSFERVIDAATASPGLWVFRKRVVGAEDYYQSTRRRVASHCQGIECIDDSTIRVRLVRPFAPFLKLLSMPYGWVIPPEAVSWYKKDFGRHPVGTGPFRFRHWNQDVAMDFVRNDRYFKRDEKGIQLPYLDAVHISFSHDTKTEFLEFRSGELDVMTSIDPTIASAVVTSDGKLRDGFQHYQLQQCCAQLVEYYGILLDTNRGAGQHSVLSRSPLLRQALNYAIDRERIVRYVLNGKGSATLHGILPPGTPGYSLETKGYSYDPDKARQLLAKAGYPGGKNLPPFILQMGTSARTVSVGEAVQQMWKEIGVSVDIRQVDFPTHLDMISSSQLQLWRTSWIGDYPDPENFLALFYSGFHSPNGPNTTHYRDPRVDSLYELALQSRWTENERYTMYHEIENIVVEDCPWIFLYDNIIQRLVQPGIDGLPLDGADRLVLERVRKSRPGDVVRGK